jgi:hypothetical protein
VVESLAQRLEMEMHLQIAVQELLVLLAAEGSALLGGHLQKQDAPGVVTQVMWEVKQYQASDLYLWQPEHLDASRLDVED